MVLIHRNIYVLFFITALFLSGCAKGWRGVPDFKHQMRLAGEKKSAIVDDLGVPDSTFIKSSSEEYWLYKFSTHYYIIVFGDKRVNGLIVEFSGDTVRSTFIVDQGIVDEIITRGWQYGIGEVVY